MVTTAWLRSPTALCTAVATLVIGAELAMAVPTADAALVKSGSLRLLEPGYDLGCRRGGLLLRSCGAGCQDTPGGQSGSGGERRAAV